jgi:hypothetical protein
MLAITPAGTEELVRDMAHRDAWLISALAGLTETERQVLRISLPLGQLTDEKVERLRGVLLEHPGSSPVLLHVGSKVLALPPEFNVDSRNGLVGVLKTLLGANAIVAA